MAKVILYTTAMCPYCVSAKNLLNSKKVSFEEVLIDKAPLEKEKMIELSGRFTVPQIFIDEKHIGGFDDLKALNEKGELDQLLYT